MTIEDRELPTWKAPRRVIATIHIFYVVVKAADVF